MFWLYLCTMVLYHWHIVFTNHNNHQQPWKLWLWVIQFRLKGRWTPIEEKNECLGVWSWYTEKKSWSSRYINGGCWCWGVSERCVALGWLQTHGIEEARHLARDFCQDALSEHFLRTLKRRNREKVRVTNIFIQDLEKETAGATK